MRYPTPDWTKTYNTAEEMFADLSVQFKGDGWYHDAEDTDYLLAIKRENLITVHVRNFLDPRYNIRKVLDLPEHF